MVQPRKTWGYPQRHLCPLDPLRYRFGYTLKGSFASIFSTISIAPFDRPN
ncbi:MAG: hypothetical protein ACO35Q_13950 [Prochlorothrix sp.]